MAAAEAELRSHLDSGEKLLWAGRPAQGIVLTRQDWYLIPFGAVWLGAAVHWPVSTAKKTPEPLALFLDLLPIGIGICIVSGRLFADLWYRSRLIYGVTDRRAIILLGMRRGSMQSIDLSSLITLKLEECWNRSGTIYFGADHPSCRHDAYGGSEFGTYAPSGQTRPGEEQFFRIADAKRSSRFCKMRCSGKGALAIWLRNNPARHSSFRCRKDKSRMNNSFPMRSDVPAYLCYSEAGTMQG